MARLARKNHEGCYFHVIVQGYEKQYIFFDKLCAQKYLNLLMTEKERFNVKILGYCIMSNHAHIMLNCSEMQQMSSYMRNVNFKFANFYNLKYERVGYVFRDRFLSEPITDEKYLYNCLSYIHMNPVKAGIVEFPNQYYFSSYNNFINKNGFVNNEILNLLFLNSQNYLDFFRFIHLGFDECMEYKKDVIKFSGENASKLINTYLFDIGIERKELKDTKILNHIYNKFIKIGISVTQIEKCIDFSHRKFLRILNK